MSRRILSFAAFAPLILAATAASREPDLGTEAQREAGRALYMEKCSQCHGESGDGKGVGGDLFKPLPRDFTSGAFKIRSTGSGELPTTEDLKSIIRRGMPYTGMPGWPKFSDEQLANLAYYIKTFYADFADPDYQADPLSPVKAPPFSEESAKRGRTVFQENKCMDCHGVKGRGDGESGPTLTDDWGQPIRPANLTKRWTFRGGPSREDIYRTIVTGLNGTPMPSYASALPKEEDRWALVDYVHSLSRADKAPYASVVVASAAKEGADLGRGRDLFRDARPALFPVVGQVIEGRRRFFPAADAVEVRAVYDSARVAVMVSWHDMSADTSGRNSPVASPEAEGPFSDAVAVQFPSEPPEGAAKPYFLSGDAMRPVEIWFRDMAAKGGRRYVGRGEGKLSEDAGFEAISGYEDGEWWFAFAKDRGDGGVMDQGAFVPVAFSVWDGFSGETGSARGITSWYSLYLEPGGAPSPYAPAAKAAAGILLLEILVVWFARRRLRASRDRMS
jgi:DMSO reductase family type II enzyme heme b subunit